MPEKHAVQKMNFEEKGSHQKSPHVLHSPSDQGHFTFPWNLLSAILSPTSWRKIPSLCPPCKAPLRSVIPAKRTTSPPENYFQRANKAAAGTPNGAAPLGRANVADAQEALLGKAKPCCSTSMFRPLAFPKVSVRKPFFPFCSYQFKQEQWIPQALQECDKVSTKPTRKVMYGPWAAAPINHFTHQSCKELRERPALQPRAQSSLHPKMHTPHTHPRPAPSLDSTCHLSTNTQACSRVKYFSFCGKCCSCTVGYCVIQCTLGMCVNTALLKAVWKILLKTLISKVYKWQKYLFLGQNLI